MKSLKRFLANEPVRALNIVTAAVALVAAFGLDVPVEALLAFVVPLLGLGEVARHRVTPVGSADDSVAG